nr:hypothetical protein CFP56_45670 [Quercus suber]
MPVPLAPFIPGKDPTIWRHETEYILERSQVLRRGIDPFASPAAGDGADDGSVGRFADGTVRDDDSP